MEHFLVWLDESLWILIIYRRYFKQPKVSLQLADTVHDLCSIYALLFGLIGLQTAPQQMIDEPLSLKSAFEFRLADWLWLRLKLRSVFC